MTGKQHAFVIARAAVPTLGVVEHQKLADAAAPVHEKVGEPPQVDIDGAVAPRTAAGVDVAAQSEAAHDVARVAETAGAVAQTEVDFVVEFAP